MNIRNIVIVTTSMVMAAITTVVTLTIIPNKLYLPYILFKVWMFGAVPIMLVYIDHKKKI